MKKGISLIVRPTKKCKSLATIKIVVQYLALTRRSINNSNYNNNNKKSKILIIKWINVTRK